MYYVPGLLYRSVGTSAATFVLATSLAFVLLAEKYSDIAARYPGGGGVVSVAEEAFGPRMGALGGMLILVDYFLTAAISSISGFTYLATLVPVLAGLRASARGGGPDPARRAQLDRHPRIGAGERRDRGDRLRRAAAADRCDRDADRRRGLAEGAQRRDGRRADSDRRRDHRLRLRLARLQRPRIAGADLARDGSAAASHGRARDAAGRDRDPRDLAAAHGARDEPAGSRAR